MITKKRPSTQGGNEKEKITDADEFTLGLPVQDRIRVAELMHKLAQELGADNALHEIKRAMELVFEAQLAINDEENFQVLLAQCGGDHETLARALHKLLRQKSREKKDQENSQNQTKRVGRPSETWGEDGDGKLMAMVMVDKEKEKMRSEGVVKPKDKDAIARLYGIPSKKRMLPKNRRLIDDYARTYSEAKALKNKKN